MNQPEIVAGLREGDVIAGKYRVERVLGVGGMGLVVAARHLTLDERVAIKLLRPQTLDSDGIARFVREARLGAKLRSEHIARVFDVDTLPNGAPYLVMELLEGRDLAAHLRELGPLPIEQAVDLILQACMAIAEAHAAGVVHRDLKPGNLFCEQRRDGRVVLKVLDFGISKATEAGVAPMTMTDAVMGTPLYMSPEQMRSSRNVDGKTDVWSLGMILYELLAGRTAFVGSSVTELAILIHGEPAPPLRTFRPDAPVALESAVLQCLEKDPRWRTTNVAALARSIAPFASPAARPMVEHVAAILGVRPAAITPGVPGGSPAVAGSVHTLAAPQTDAPVGRTARPRDDRGPGRTRWVLPALVLAAATVAAGAMIALRPVAQRPVVPSPPSAPAEPAAAAIAPRVTSPEPTAVATAPSAATVVDAGSGPASATVAEAKGKTPAPVRPVALATPTPPSAARPTATPCKLTRTVDKNGEAHFACPCATCD